MFYYLLANLLPSCCAGLNFLNCGVIDIMILLIRAIKSNSFWILSAEENFVIKEESVQAICRNYFDYFMMMRLLWLQFNDKYR